MAHKNDKDLNHENELNQKLHAQESEVEQDNIDQEEKLSSLELMWKMGFDELDAWAERLNYRDEIFLDAARHYVDRVKRNQENMKTITAQFNKELFDWEKSAREELLMTTTTLQHFFPIKSYEEINRVVDDIQNKTTSLLSTPLRALTSGQAADKYLETIEQYISFRKKSRQKYIENVKKATNVLYENQKVFVNLFSKQLKAAILPFQKYMEKTSELTKS